MDAFRVWLMGLMAVALILTVLSSVLPEGSVKKIAGVTGGWCCLWSSCREPSGWIWASYSYPTMTIPAD